MVKNISISFYDVCLPDYFGGHHKPVLQYPVDGATTRKQLCNGLLSELDIGVIEYEIEQNGLDYDSIRKAVRDGLYFKPECQDNDLLFPDLETLPEDEIEPCHAFFVVRWEEEESE